MKRRVDGFDGYSMGERGYGFAEDGGRDVSGPLADALVPSWGEKEQRWRMERGHGFGQQGFQDPFGFPAPAWQTAQGGNHSWASSRSTGSLFTPIFPNQDNAMKPQGTSSNWFMWHASPYDDRPNHHVYPHSTINDFYHSAVSSNKMQPETSIHSAASYFCSETAYQNSLRSLQLLPTNPVFPDSSGDTSMNSIKDKDAKETMVQEELKTGFGELQAVLHKDLTNSDVGNIGRIVLPKREAESYLPPLSEREGMFLHMDDLTLPVTWRFKYRYWPNNKSRMYILENTGSFVKTHGLEAGDSFLIYKSESSGNYVACGKKVIKPWHPKRVLHSGQNKNTCSNNEDCNNVQGKKRNKLSGALLMEDNEKQGE